MWVAWDLPQRFEFWRNCSFYWNADLLKESRTVYPHFNIIIIINIIAVAVELFISRDHFSFSVPLVLSVARRWTCSSSADPNPLLVPWGQIDPGWPQVFFSNSIISVESGWFGKIFKNLWFRESRNGNTHNWENSVSMKTEDSVSVPCRKQKCFSQMGEERKNSEENVFLHFILPLNYTCNTTEMLLWSLGKSSRDPPWEMPVSQTALPPQQLHWVLNGHW